MYLCIYLFIYLFVYLFFHLLLMNTGSNCRSERVNITLRSEQWNETLSNSETNEFKALERILASTVSYSLSQVHSHMLNMPQDTHVTKEFKAFVEVY